MYDETLQLKLFISQKDKWEDNIKTDVKEIGYFDSAATTALCSLTTESVVAWATLKKTKSLSYRTDSSLLGVL
jgi:hypothetical protein